MDKKTIYGLVLIGLILSVFTIVNQPSAAELAKIKKENAKIEAKAIVMVHCGISEPVFKGRPCRL